MTSFWASCPLESSEDVDTMLPKVLTLVDEGSRVEEVEFLARYGCGMLPPEFVR